MNLEKSVGADQLVRTYFDVLPDCAETVQLVADRTGVSVAGLLQAIVCPEFVETDRPMLESDKQQFCARLTEGANSTLKKVAANEGVTITNLLNAMGQHFPTPAEVSASPRWGKIIQSAREITNKNRKVGGRTFGAKSRNQTRSGTTNKH